MLSKTNLLTLGKTFLRDPKMKFHQYLINHPGEIDHNLTEPALCQGHFIQQNLILTPLMAALKKLKKKHFKSSKLLQFSLEFPTPSNIILQILI